MKGRSHYYNNFIAGRSSRIGGTHGATYEAASEASVQPYFDEDRDRRNQKAQMRNSSYFYMAAAGVAIYVAFFAK